MIPYLLSRNLNWKESFEFDFPLEGEYSIRGRYKKDKNSENIFRIEEIIELSGKKLSCSIIEIKSPFLKRSKQGKESEIRSFKKVEFDNKKLDSEKEGVVENYSKNIEMKNNKHIYDENIYIIKIKEGEVQVRNIKYNDTKEFDIERESLISGGDSGGGNLAGVEYIDINDVCNVHGKLEEFVELLKVMGKQYNFLTITYMINELPKGKKERNFQSCRMVKLQESIVWLR